MLKLFLPLLVCCFWVTDLSAQVFIRSSRGFGRSNNIVVVNNNRPFVSSAIIVAPSQFNSTGTYGGCEGQASQQILFVQQPQFYNRDAIIIQQSRRQRQFIFVR